MNSFFTEYDMDSWKYAGNFTFYTKVMPTGFNTCVDLDITKTYDLAKINGVKFSACYLFLLSKIMNEVENFRIIVKNDKPGFYNKIIPGFSVFHKDDNSNSLLWVDYNPDESFAVFEGRFSEEMSKYGSNHGFLSKEGMPPENCFIAGILPWISFTSYSPVPYKMSNCFFPITESGKIKKCGEQKFLPFSITVHHGVCDGYLLSVFLKRFQDLLSKPEMWF